MPSDQPRILITGAGSGIGRALAVEAARNGARLALCGRRGALLEETARLAGADSAIVVEADITDPGDRRRIAQTVMAAMGGLDMLVNNAGVVRGGPLADMRDEDVAQTFDTNVRAPILLTRDLLPLIPNGTGRIVNIGSVFGDISYPGFSVYSASKFALRGFSDALRRELKPRGIAVTYVAPRATRTPAASAFEKLIAASGMKLDEPETVARQVWRELARGRERIYPAGPERFFVLVEKLFPAVVSRALSKQAN